MAEITTPASLILCLLLGTLPGSAPSQVQNPLSPEESLPQHVRQRQEEFQRRVEEQREQMIRRQEEFWQRFGEQERQRLQQSWQNLGDEERQRQEESLRQREEQRRQMIQRQRAFWQRHKEQEKERQQRGAEQRRKDQERQKAVRKAADEYSDEVWQEMLDATPEQWQALKPRLEQIRRLKDLPYVDVSIYWIAGSTSYHVESLAESPDGTRSLAKASGWFSVTTGVGSTSESHTRSGANGESRGTSGGQSHSFTYRRLQSDQYSAMTRTGPAAEDSNRPGTEGQAYRAGDSRGHVFATGAIEFALQVPGPIKKQVGDIDLGWQWERPSLDKSPDTLSESDSVCERLVNALEMKDPDPVQVREGIETLRRVRRQKRAELEEARQQLLALVTPEQEAKLILMGYLE